MITSLSHRITGLLLSLLCGKLGYAGGFSLYTENSTHAVGNFAAGVAAEGADASSGWYNPAALVMIKTPQVVLSGVGALPTAEITGTSTYSTLGALPYIQPFSHVNGAQNGFVPSFHLALPFGERYAFGLNMIAPVGLASSYPVDSAVRYAAALSAYDSINMSPVLMATLSDYVSVGGGPDFQYATMKFTNIIGSPAEMIALGLPATTLDSKITNKGHSFNTGFHAGLLIMLHEKHTRIGLNYQSAITHEFKGSSSLVGRLADPLLNLLNPVAGNANAIFSTRGFHTNDVTFPYVVTLSGYQDLNEKWAVLGSIVYTGWSSLQLFVLDNIAASAPNNIGGVNLLQYNENTPLDYKNTWRFAVGGNYQVNDQWMMRAGIGYDETPTVNSARNVNLADINRWALAVGTHYQLKQRFGLDVGYAFLIESHGTSINSNYTLGSTSVYHVNARTKGYGHLLGIQGVWQLDKTISA